MKPHGYALFAAFGFTTAKVGLARRLAAFTRVPWNQDKIDQLWQACNEINYRYNIQIDPRFLLAIIIQEGTGSFNTSSTNRAADGQHGIETDFVVDLMKANNLIFGKTLGYIYYGNEFNKAVSSASALGTYPGVSGSGSVFQYVNWQTPIIDVDKGLLRNGVYAGHGDWHSGVSVIYEILTWPGAAREYSDYLSNINAFHVEKLTNNLGISLKEYTFSPQRNAQNHLGQPSGNYTITTD